MIRAIATAACVGSPRTADTLARLMRPHAAESPAVLHVVAARLLDVRDHRLQLTPELAARRVEQARTFVADGGRVSLAGWVSR